MRLNRSSDFRGAMVPHAGTLLLAHPELMDPNFYHTVVLLSAYSQDEGSVGVIVNRPLGKSLGEYDPKLLASTLSSVPLYSGGPVATDRLILVAWRWCAEESAFKLYFGIDAERAERILENDPEFKLYGFLGHAGWTGGQLEAELSGNSWVMSGALPVLANAESGINWHELLCDERPELRLLADAPEDPSLN
jgi:putative transcriptional regulator